MRTAEIRRKTNETDISLSLNLDGSGKSEIKCGCGFLEHMLTLFAKHAHFDLTLSCVGDTYVDDHHTVEDIGIALGEAFAAALGDKKGIARYADKVYFMRDGCIYHIDRDASGMPLEPVDEAAPAETQAMASSPEDTARVSHQN